MSKPAPKAPLNPLCRADMAEDVVHSARMAIAFLRNVQMMTGSERELGRNDSTQGQALILEVVHDALQYAQDLVEHERAKDLPALKAV